MRKSRWPGTRWCRRRLVREQVSSGSAQSAHCCRCWPGTCSLGDVTIFTTKSKGQAGQEQDQGMGKLHKAGLGKHKAGLSQYKAGLSKHWGW